MKEMKQNRLSVSTRQEQVRILYLDRQIQFFHSFQFFTKPQQNVDLSIKARRSINIYAILISLRGKNNVLLIKYLCIMKSLQITGNTSKKLIDRSYVKRRSMQGVMFHHDDDVWECIDVMNAPKLIICVLVTSYY